MTMLERNATGASDSVWTGLAAPLPADAIQWRQQGKPGSRDGRFFARFVAYIDAQFVRERMDSVIPGEWDLTLELLPPCVTTDGEEVEPFSFKARLQVLGVIREDVGTGKDYKQAATDAFKRAAVRFGVGTELYAMDHLWVPMDGDGKFAKPLEDPSVLYARKTGGSVPARPTLRSTSIASTMPSAPAVSAPSATTTGTETEPECPKCGGKMWDNRATKRNPKAPDYKCRDRSCDGVLWPPKTTAVAASTEEEFAQYPGGLEDEDGPLPF